MFTIHPSSLTALPAPQVTITPSGSSTAGSPYTLTCTVMVVNGLVVVPQVMWLKNGASVVVGNGISVTPGVVSANTTTLTLQFNLLRTSDGGQYSCFANVSLPIISITSLFNISSVNLTVQSESWCYFPSCLTLPSSPVPPPTVTITAVPSQVITVGDGLTLTCNIQLDPSVDSTVMVNSTWTSPGGAIITGTIGNMAATSAIQTSPFTSTLMITMATISNGGTYVCSAVVSPQSPSPYITPSAGGSGLTQVYIGECVSQ